MHLPLHAAVLACHTLHTAYSKSAKPMQLLANGSFTGQQTLSCTHVCTRHQHTQSQSMQALGKHTPRCCRRNDSSKDASEGCDEAVEAAHKEEKVAEDHKRHGKQETGTSDREKVG